MLNKLPSADRFAADGVCVCPGGRPTQPATGREESDDDHCAGCMCVGQRSGVQQGLQQWE